MRSLVKPFLSALFGALVATVLVLSVSRTDPQSIESLKDPLRVMGSSALLEVKSSLRPGLGFGSGVIVESTKKDGKFVLKIVTSKHVVASLRTLAANGDEVYLPLKIILWKYESGDQAPIFYEHSGNVLRVSQRYDLALVEVTSNSDWPVAPLSKGGLKIYEKIFAVGSPSRLPPMVTEGRISHPNFNPDGEEDLVEASVSVWHGNSGGGVYNSRGELVGVVTAIWDNIPHLALFSKLENLREFLSEK